MRRSAYAAGLPQTSEALFKMLKSFVCGASRFEEDDDEVQYGSFPSSAPRKSVKKICRKNSNNRDSDNPYSTRGLDKFSDLLIDLQHKRDKIYANVGSDHISIVRFVYSNSGDCVPVVVKLGNPRSQISIGYPSNQQSHSPKSEEEDVMPIKERNQERRMNETIGSIELDRLRKPSYYLPVVLVLVLLMLAVLGRSGAVLCISCTLYFVPMMEVKRGIHGSKIEKARRMSVKKTVSALSSPNNGGFQSKEGRRR